MDIHSIKKTSYCLNSKQIDFQLDHVRRSQFFAEVTRVRDVYPAFWILYVFDELPGRLCLENKMGTYPVEGRTAVYVPPHELVTFCHQPGWFHWVAYSCFLPPDHGFPQKVTIFPWPEAGDIDSYNRLADILRCAGNDQSLLLPEAQSSSLPLVQRTKLLLDQNFTDDILLSDLVKELTVSPSTMTHAFSQHYGISPVAYRNLLRSFDALRRISLGESVVAAAAQVGFSDYSRFYRNFNTALGCPPSDFSRRGFTRCQPDDALRVIRRA